MIYGMDLEAFQVHLVPLLVLPAGFTPNLFRGDVQAEAGEEGFEPPLRRLELRRLAVILLPCMSLIPMQLAMAVRTERLTFGYLCQELLLTGSVVYHHRQAVFFQARIFVVEFQAPDMVFPTYQAFQLAF
jgi:hypothetical protein